MPMYYTGESAIHDACSQFFLQQFQAERGLFQEDLRKRLVQKYDKISTEVTDLQVSVQLFPDIFTRCYIKI